MADTNYNNEFPRKQAPGAKEPHSEARFSAGAEAYSPDENYVQYEKRDFDPIRTRRDGKTGCLGGLMYFIFVISVSIILACLGWMAASDVLALNKEELTAEVTIPEEYFHQEQRDVVDENGNVTGTETVSVADIGSVARALKDAGIIEYKSLFRFYSMISNADVKIDPGTYELSTIYDYRAIVKKMQFGSDSQVRTMVTFPEGFTMEDIFKRLEENKICKYDDLMECAANYQFGYAFLEGIEYGDARRLEGFLFPDTYEFYQGMTADAAIDKFLQTIHYKLTAEMWELAEAKGLTMREIVTIASMVEKEAANDDERATIAGVIYNRLNANMYLGIDATVQYALPERKAVLTYDDLGIDSPYNTYKNLGLPAGPIASPGMPSINAAFKPASHNYYYYALDEASGTHRFFTNSSEHDAFVKTQSYGQ